MRSDLADIWKLLWVRIAVYGIAAVVLLRILGFIFGGAKGAIVTLVLAFAFAYLTAPVVRSLERRRVPRFAGVLLVYVGLILFVGLSSVLIADMAAQLARFANDLPQILAPLIQWAQNLPNQVGQIKIPPPLQEAFQQAAQNLQSLLQGFTQTLLNGLQALLSQGGNLIGFVTSLLGGVFQLFTALIISIYLIYDLPKIAQTLLHAVPVPYQPLVINLAGKLDKAVGGYLRGQLMVALGVGMIVTVGLLIFGIPLAGSLGFLAGVFNLIPFVGVIISSVPAVLLALTIGWPQVIATLGVLVAANQIEAHVLSPRIIGQTTSLHPVSIISAILIGSSLFGLVGALLSVPLVSFLKVIYQEFYLNSKFYQDG